ncbi:MAG: efflux RND transporter permease subunit [Armatimonadetes bacterium]|nr:efflux RND transporter permease subunit [Armatimonadota bacterium]
MGLTKLALSRPVFMLMLMLLAILMGFISYFSMRQEENPDVNLGVVNITTIYPGAGPDEINTLVTRKVEEAVSSVEGLREVTSISQEGVSAVTCQFEIGTNMDRALNDSRAKVDAILNQLPQAVQKPTISKFDFNAAPVLTMVLRSDRYNNRDLRNLVEEKLKDRFARVPGVAQVDVNGGEEREIQVQVKKDRLLALGVGISDVLRAIQSANLNVPSGHMQAGDQEFAVRVLGDYKSVEDIGKTTLSIRSQKMQGGRSTSVRLSDVAEIKDTSAERRVWSRLDGSDTVVMSISKTRDGNAVEITDGAEQAIKGIESEYGIHFVKTNESAERIKESLFDLNMALIIGILLVSAIVYVFLHNFRGMLIVATAIPICLLTSIIALKALGFTINVMSMLALSLAIGVLVDDAIVVLENIYRHLKMGEDPVTAAINGRSEIGLAAIAITMADVVVFVPIATMGGIIGQFFKPLGVAFVCATLLSLLVSFTITPMLAARWYREGEDVEHPQGWFHAGIERIFVRLQDAYRHTLAWALEHRWFVFISGFVVLLAAFMFIGGSFAPDMATAIQTGMGPFVFAVIVGVIVMAANFFRGYRSFKYIPQAAAFGAVFILGSVMGFEYAQWKGEAVFKFAFMPPQDGGSVGVSLVLPPGSTLAETEQSVKKVESIVKTHPDVKYVLSYVGTRGAGNFAGGDAGTNYGQVSISLNDKESKLEKLLFWVHPEGKQRSKDDTAVAAEIQERLGRIAGVQMTVSTGGGQGFGAPIQMSFRSDNRESLLKAVKAVELGLREGKIKGVVSPEISAKPGKPEIRAIPDRARLADVGLTAADVATTMRVLYEGDNTNKLRILGTEYDIRVMMSMEDRNTPNILTQLPMSFVEGQPVYLGQVATLENGVGLDKVRRRDRTEEVTLSANLLPGFAAGTVQREIDQWMAKEKLVPSDVMIKPLGQADIQARESGYLLGALVIAFILVFMLLASLFNNLLYPFIIQLAQPQAMVGALLALVLTDKTLNIVGMVGIICLVGLVGKNAILVVDYTNTLRARGRSRKEALLEAGPIRLRPIMMTTLALLFGMLPVALALGRGSEFRETIGITIIGGMILSSLLTLLVIPCSYTIFDDISEAFNRRKGKKSSGKPDRTMGTRVLESEGEGETVSR